MRLLVDTNIILEILREQRRAPEARALLLRVPENEFFLSDLSLHSIGIILLSRKLHDVFSEFLTDMMPNAGMGIVSLAVEDMRAVVESAQKFNLSFDDAYQYVSAEKHGFTIVSFDDHFDRTDRGRKTPAELLQA